jgi:hypothetical protein
LTKIWTVIFILSSQAKRLHCFKSFLNPCFGFCVMIVTLEGFTLPSGYLVKELTILYTNNDYQHFHFKSPEDFAPTGSELRTIKYATSYLHQLPLYDRNPLPYSMLATIVTSLRDDTIVVAGSAAFNLIRDFLPFSRIIDICESYNFKYPPALPPTHCFRNHQPRHCSLAKGQFISLFFQENSINL